MISVTNVLVVCLSVAVAFARSPTHTPPEAPNTNIVLGGGGVPGGASHIEVDDEVKALALKATINSFNAASNDMHHFQMAGVLSAKSQVVAGTMKHLHVLLRETSCRKNDDEIDIQECEPKSNGKTKLCYFTIWTKGWVEGFEEIKNKGCNNIAYKEESEPTIEASKRSLDEFGKAEYMELKKEVLTKQMQVMEKMDQVLTKWIAKGDSSSSSSSSESKSESAEEEPETN